MVKVTLLVPLATEVAVIVTVVAEGMVAGAVYVTEVVVDPLSAPAPVAGDKVQVTPLFVESWVTVAAMVVDCPAARDAPALETRLIASGAELPQLAMKRAAMRAKIKKEVRTDPLTEGADCDMLGILFLDPRWRSPATRLAGFPGPNL